jgi:hypothetical protein
MFSFGMCLWEARHDMLIIRCYGCTVSDMDKAENESGICDAAVSCSRELTEKRSS